jgi:cytochrome c biogenesis protein CcmG/thiol:disulfide interchange protein DsbE
VGLGVFLLLLFGACSGAADQDRGPTGVQVGDRAAGFTLSTLAGDDISLGDYQGSVVLINFWATWCEPCRQEMPDFQDAYKAASGDGLVVLGVNYQQKAVDVVPFVEELGLTFPVLLDPAVEVGRLYRVRGLPMTVIVDREGIVRVRHVGYLPAELLRQYLEDVDA